MMNILIVDDEKPARDRLRRLLEDVENANVIGEAENGVQAIKAYEAQNADVILLDIRMPLMDGMETARHLMANEQPPAIIFTTAYGEHALQAFEAHAVDYLVKPIRPERLQDALNSAQRLNRAQLDQVSNDFTDNNARTHICVRKGNALELVPVENIYYFMADNKYVSIVHQDGEALLDEALINLEEEFQQSFFRVHRNALVALNQISGLSKESNNTHTVLLKDSDTAIEVSRRHLPAVRKLVRSKP